jgi:processing peptidase subunit beta
MRSHTKVCPHHQSRTQKLFSDLHRAAQPLGRTILGPKNNIPSIKRDDLSSYLKTNYSADRMVLVGAGGVNHGELVKAAEKAFGMLHVSLNSNPLGRKARRKPNFVSLEVRICDDDVVTAHIAVAVVSVSWSSPDYYPVLAMQSIFGNWNRALGSAPLPSSRPSAKHNLANSYMSFSTSYSDTGSGLASVARAATRDHQPVE